MKTLALSVLLASSITTASVFAAAPAGAPSGTMGMCKDGTYSSSAEKKGACRGHKGVQDWYGEGSSSKAAMPTASERAAEPPPTATSKMSRSEKSASPAMAGRTSGEPMTAAAGGGAGKVWGNDNTKVYHCNGDKWYGKTKHGEYMSESDAKAKGFHADHGRACS